jgi:hypothetical protein
LVRMPRGHPEALTDAWANLYLELATAIAARRGIAAPVGTGTGTGDVAFATIEDGLRGMAFCQSAVVSHATGRWVPIEGA